MYVGGHDRNKKFNYCSNYISTTKYTLITFLPRSLLEQFMRVMNVYFLATAVLQSIPEISPLNPFSAIAPLVFVLAVSMTREGVEDYMRYRSDKETNSVLTQVYRGGKFCEVTSKEVNVGDLVLVRKNEVFPCDLIQLSCSSENGICYIETSSLDGEKALKPRYVLSPTRNLYKDSQFVRFYSKVVCEQPNPQLYSFMGNIEVDNTQWPIGKNHILLAGSFLRNTEWTMGAAVYTGTDCKLRQNLSGRRFKQSRIEKQVNKFIILIVLLQVVLCGYSAVSAGMWTANEWDGHWYLGDTDYEPWVQGVLNYFTYFLLLNTMIPISLIVSLEIVKVGQGLFMQFDQEMYSDVTDRACKVSSFSLNEELGMIGHVFSHKTGTLTCNKMEFKRLTIGLKSYAIGEDDESESNLQQFMSDLNAADAQSSHNALFLKCMSLCHECLIDTTQEGKKKFTGQSPDEVAILDAAKLMGYEFLGTSNGVISLVKDTAPIQYSQVCTFEFDSDRKRSSVVVIEQATNKAFLFIKGADSVINPLLGNANSNDIVENVRKDLHIYAKKGYRTLMLGFRQIPDTEFRNWKERFELASRAIENRDCLLYTSDAADE